VLLVEVSDILDVPELLYVAVTRARLKLLMIGTGRELGDLRNLLQELPPRQASLNTVQI
jgi:ATP-dependent exoDNAse (exonuclease V) beta subunit